MLLNELDPVVADSYPELHSDHDVMFVLEHMKVWESEGQKV